MTQPVALRPHNLERLTMNIPLKLSRLACLLVVVGVLPGCGQKGDLYLPDQDPDHATTAPTQGASRDS